MPRFAFAMCIADNRGDLSPLVGSTFLDKRIINLDKTEFADNLTFRNDLQDDNARLTREKACPGAADQMEALADRNRLACSLKRHLLERYHPHDQDSRGAHSGSCFENATQALKWLGGYMDHTFAFMQMQNLLPD